jgi:hypothetical protein
VVPEGSDPTTEVEHAAPTDEFSKPPESPPGRPVYLALIFCAVAAGAFLIGIGLATATRTTSDESTVAAQTVGPAGGTVRFEGGELRVPEGAVSEPTRFVVRRSLVRDRVRVRADADPIVVEPGRLIAYSFAPVDITFTKKVRITFRLPSGARNGSAFARTGNEIVLLAGTIDQARETATVEVRDFKFDTEPASTPTPSASTSTPSATSAETTG